LALVLLLASLSLVTWRQSRALEVSRAVEDARQARALMESEVARLEARVRALESRARVVREAGTRLGMRMPGATEIVILPVPAASDADSAADADEASGSVVGRVGRWLRNVASRTSPFDEGGTLNPPEVAEVAAENLVEIGGER